jgi:MoaA/NifB/PqqE/SkfB family radical SAM enzyme
MNLVGRTARHARLTLNNYRPHPQPSFLVLFVNSICNMKCEHCFYWKSLNRPDDLTLDEIVGLSRSMGRLETLNLSGGEPFIRGEIAEVCLQFVRQNGVRQIYVPTNGWYTEKTVRAVRAILAEKDLDLIALELSLDGMPEFHDRFRVAAGSFRKAMETYDALAAIQAEDPRLRIHSISTATDANLAQIRPLTTYLYERCPRMDHHNLAIIRGDRKNPALAAPILDEYQKLYDYIRRLWAPREESRYGAIVEPMLQWAKLKTAREQRQVVPCRAGRISAVVYANGDVSVCELHEPIGNLRRQTFPEIWESAAADRLRRSVANKECHCTTEVFLWSSIVYQPPQLAQAMLGARVWRKPRPLEGDERAPVALGPDGMPAARGEPAGPL